MGKNYKVLMIGSDITVKGGIVSVIKNYIGYNNWGCVKLDFVPTHRDGNNIFKILFFMLSFFKIAFKLLKFNYDIVHIHVSERASISRKMFIVNYIKKFYPNIKIVLHHHGAEFDKYYDSLSFKKKNKVINLLSKVDINIVLSNLLIDMIISKAPNAKVQVLYNAVPSYDKNMYNIKSNNILFLGRLGSRKGTYDFLDVVIDLKDFFMEKGITVSLCGDGEISNVKKIIDENGLQSIIRHVGWIEKEEKDLIFKDTMINVLPSYNEGLPMTILETMSFGIPNISTSIASIPEVIKNGENGYLIKPGDKEKLKECLVDLIIDSNLRSRISENSFTTIKNGFSIEKNIDKLTYIYQFICGDDNEK